MPDQLLLFDSDGSERSIDDLDGLMFGNGHVVRRDGGVRVSIVVAQLWRAQALADELSALGLAATYDVNRDDSEAGYVVGTEPTSQLGDLATRWQPGKGRTDTARLTSGALRLWALSGGRRTDVGYLLPLAASDEARWPRSGAALANRGLTATLVGARSGGPAYRITGVKRLTRLATLVGERPGDVPESAWP